MNVLFFVETGCGNGRAMVDEAVAIHDNTDINVYTMSSNVNQEPGLLTLLHEDGIENIILDGLDKHDNFRNHCKIIRKCIQNKKIDIVHVQTNWELLLVRMSLIGIGRCPKVIYTIHSFRNNKSWLKKNIARTLITVQLLLFVDKVIATSNFLYSNFKIVRYKMIILPLGVDNRFMERTFVCLERGLRIIFPGMFREGKGQDMLIRAFYQYTIESVDNSSLVFLPGDGEMLDSCKQLVNDFKLNKQILFPGRLSKEEVLDYFDRSNILVCTSISETFSQILAEAFCLGKCIISTPVGIANDIIEDEKNGFIINNETQLKNVLLKLSDNLQLVNNMGLNNFTQKEQFSWQRISQDYAIICKSLLKQINNE